MNRCRKIESDIFQIRMLTKKVICMSGEEAAKVFYDPDKFVRKDAIPKRVQRTLMGENAVQTMDGSTHQHRKQLFMSVMNPELLKKLTELTEKEWEIAIFKWKGKSTITLFDEVQEMLCRVACYWVGVPFEEEELPERARDFGTMVDAFGAVGPRHWQGKQARARAEKWIETIVEDIRSGMLEADPASPLSVISFYKDQNGELLDVHMAAVEVINLLRPIVAIATYITFAALALHEYPQCAQKLQNGEDDYQTCFVQEVRRFYPFGPFLGARVKEDFDWKGYMLEKGVLVLLDIYGTNRDHRSWNNPDQFDPERFKNWQGNDFNFIPQGGGDQHNGHRCAGEWITLEVLRISLRYLNAIVEYKVPEQNLSFSMVRMPTLPKSRFVITDVRPKNAFKWLD
jgi:fatty-acid peroxygenase